MIVILNEQDGINYIKNLQFCKYYNYNVLKSLYKFACDYQEEIIEEEKIEDIIEYGILVLKLFKEID